MSEFPPELISRILCDNTVYVNREDYIHAVLRQSGHAELVAALKFARLFVQDMPTDEADECLAKVDAALAKAGAAS